MIMCSLCEGGRGYSILKAVGRRYPRIRKAQSEEGMAEQGRAMRTGLVDLFFNDLKQPWSRWNKIALTLSISWLALMSYVLSRSGPSREFEVLSSVGPGILWITVGVGIVALTKKGAGKIVTLFLLIVSIVALGLPILVLTLIWIPMLVLERLSLRD